MAEGGRSLRNGSWSCRERVATSSVGGDFAIVALSAAGSREMAANVVPMSGNSWALTPATGAKAPVKRFKVWRKRASWVRLSASWT